MSKKHFEAVAKEFRAMAECSDVQESKTAKDVLVAMAGRMADVFADANPRFDRRKFLTACGM